MFTAKRVGALPEDDLEADPEDADPDHGFFSPHSWWPLALGGSVAIIAYGWVFAAWVVALGSPRCSSASGDSSSVLPRGPRTLAVSPSATVRRTTCLWVVRGGSHMGVSQFRRGCDLDFCPHHVWERLTQRSVVVTQEVTRMGASVQMAGQRGKVMAAVVGSFSAAIVVAGCGPMLTASAGTGDNESQATISVTPALNARTASVLDPIVVKADLGILTSVAVTGPEGQIPGTMSADGATWTSEAGLELPFDTKYDVTAVAIDPEGRAREVNKLFTTVKPAATPTPGTRYTTDYVTYGVGMPLVIPFKSAVTNKAEVESKLKLTTSQPVEGAWSWSDDFHHRHLPPEGLLAGQTPT